MICGGHATRAHIKILENYSKWKKPTKQFVDLHKRNHPNIDNFECKCNTHRSGCGCLRDEFITRAHNNFSYILRDSDFAKRMRALSKHARDEHVREVVNAKGKTEIEYCEFYSQKVCSCGQCKSNIDFTCDNIQAYVPLTFSFVYS